MSQQATSKIHLQDFQAFECTLCGKCCIRKWNLHPEPAKFPAISQSKIYQRIEKEGYTPIVTADDGHSEFGRRENDECVFLEEIEAGSICGLRAESGNSMTPVNCQVYPYQPVVTPEGVFFHASFTCPPIVSGQDKDAESNRQSLAEIIGRVGPKTYPDEDIFEVNLSAERRISWRNYLELEQKIVQSLDPKDPVDSCLKTVLTILDTIQRSPESEEIDWSDFQWGQQDFEFARQMYVKFLAFAACQVELNFDIDGWESYALAIEEGRPTYSSQYKLEIPPRVQISTLEPWVLNVFDRYMRNSVLGKAVLSPSVIGRLLTNALTLELTSIFGRALSQRKGEPEMTMDSLFEAFEIAELDVKVQRKSDLLLNLEIAFQKVLQLPPTQD